jgi:hypothetical protein
VLVSTRMRTLLLVTADSFMRMLLAGFHVEGWRVLIVPDLASAISESPNSLQCDCVVLADSFDSLALLNFVGMYRFVKPNSNLFMISGTSQPSVSLAQSGFTDLLIGRAAVEVESLNCLGQVLIDLFGDLSLPKPVRRTSRQEEVLNLIARGQDNAEIAKALKITSRAVEMLILRTFKRLGYPERLGKRAQVVLAQGFLGQRQLI